jgi:hypothetical protein
MINRLNNFFYLPKVEKQLFWEALVLVFKTRLIIAFYPIRKYSVWLGIQNAESAMENNESFDDELLRIKKAVNRSSKYLLFKRKCLVEAMVAKQLLDKRGIASTIYFGVAKNDKKKLIAHAWLRCGNQVITGKKEMCRFTKVSCFS